MAVNLHDTKQHKPSAIYGTVSANLTASQTAQTAQLIQNNTAQTAQLAQRIAPYPVPAYIVSNPNTSGSTTT